MLRAFQTFLSYQHTNPTFTDQNIAQRAVANYANSIPPTYDVNSAIQAAHDEAVSKGIPNVPAATTTTKVFTDRAEAEAYVKNYTDSIPPTYDVNSAIEAAYDEAVVKGIPNVSKGWMSPASLLA